MSARSHVLRSFTAAILSVFGLAGTVGQASAHVSYGQSLFSDSSIIDPVTGANGTGIINANPNRTVSSNAGWLAGQNSTTWANSHDNRFLYFNLAQTSTVNFTLTGNNTNGNGVLNPGYSLFQGVALNAVHDGATVPASYIGAQTGFASWSPFAAANTAITANGGTLSTQHWGQYRSNADFTMANDSGQAYTLQYTGLSGSNGSGNTVTGTYTLGPGIYSLVVGGANANDTAALLNAAIATGGNYCTAVSASCTAEQVAAGSANATAYSNLRLARTLGIEFNVSPVPIPAAAWLFGSGIAGIVALARRRASR
ncbi:MAG: VPLPA-CTERM sorting domain-containing protein [Nitrospira sp.]|nr:VPLPA-CTERM sorting domain-containing protein [Nitrospira sp.]MBS0154606.1 VPLPA-CTERM sorting domain-containing protein [Nitrospira sp.]MBS0166434.1 VPLPA-CTERM sorting domain-containing protein [Nitrospira sp.]